MRSFNISLPLSWKREQGDNQLRTFWKSAFNLFFAYILYILRLMQWFFFKSSYYPIEYEISLTTTRVIFTRSKRTTQPICLKLWQRSDDVVCDTRLVISDARYLLEGFAFNRKFAPDVYLGIAPVEVSRNKIKRGRLIDHPELNTLKKHGVQYALVMRCIKENWGLDYHLCQNRLGKNVSIDFLAKEVAYMHKQLDSSPDNYGTPDRISSKLNLNTGLFLEALGQLSDAKNKLEKYGWISDLMVQACEDYAPLFMQRYQNGHIKRCHGDLKATNLWVQPKGIGFSKKKEFPYFDLKKHHQQLLALDCIDFNPEFCHIDTLSDVAMLAVDIEMHFTNWTETDKKIKDGQNIANSFLYGYLHEMEQDHADAWPLLRYYMTEKAMVCAYVSILYDGQSELGERYLDIADIHAHQLGKSTEPSMKSMALVVS